jgi:dihydrofolate synthase
MIDLGLARISRLLARTPQSWKAVHVAGTNGKGSICAYLSAMLHGHGLRCARFTSPHLVDRWDCIVVDEQPVSEALFRDAERLVSQRDRDGGVGATEFELLTATAFEIFEREKVAYGVVEVGMGGTLDATNAMHHKAVAVIAKIGLDHQGFLGDTLEAIARHKAGIMRPGVPCVVDPTNRPSVMDAIRAHAKDVGAEVFTPRPALDHPSTLAWEGHQLQNFACAEAALRLVCGKSSSPFAFEDARSNMSWPGRLDVVDLGKLTAHQGKVLLDGAHNPQSAEILAACVEDRLRSDADSITWVLAASAGKDLSGILEPLLQPQDHVTAVQFGPVDGMPWVKAADPTTILQVVRELGVTPSRLHDAGDDVHAALQWASTTANSGPIVIAGSLYLVSDTLRLLRSAESHTISGG